MLPISWNFVNIYQHWTKCKRQRTTSEWGRRRNILNESSVSRGKCLDFKDLNRHRTCLCQIQIKFTCSLKASTVKSLRISCSLKPSTVKSLRISPSRPMFWNLSCSFSVVSSVISCVCTRRNISINESSLSLIVLIPLVNVSVRCRRRLSYL